MGAVIGDIVRTDEWRSVRDFAVDARTSPAGLALEGEAGAGKSVLWRAGVEAAVDAGHRLLRSEPSANEADLSFAGLFDLLSEVLPLVARDIPVPQREELEVALLLRKADEQPPTYRGVGLAVLAALRSCASAGPVLLAIDDVQWLDDESRDSLTFALRRLGESPVSLLVAARAEAMVDPLTLGAPPPSERWRDLFSALPISKRISLQPLDLSQMRRLLPQNMTGKQAQAVAELSRGNPFWANEISASWESAGSWEPANTTLSPLTGALRQRLARSLSADAAEALTVVAAAGRISMKDALAAMAHLDDPARALDATVLAGVALETGGRLAVAHPLIGAAVLESIPPLRRAVLYRRLAAVSDNAERYAHFVALASAPGPDTETADSLDAATTAAHSRGANEAAARFAAQAVQFTPELDREALARRRIRAGEMLFLAGDVKHSLEHLELLDIDRLPTPELERALPLLLDMMEVVRGAAAPAAVVARAVDKVDSDLRRRALLLALASDVAYGIRGSRRAAAAEAIRCAEAAGDAAHSALHRAIINLVVAKVTGGEGLDSDLLDRAARLEADHPVARLHDTAELHRGLWSRYLEDLETARAFLQRTVARARQSGDDYALSVFLSYLAATEELAGDFAAAAAAIESAELASAWHSWSPSGWHIEPRCELLIARGDLDGAVSLVDEHLPDHPEAPLANRFIRAIVLGRVSSWKRHFAAAAREYELAAWCAEQCDWVDPGVRHRLDPGLAEAYVYLDRREEAQAISASLREVGVRLHRPALLGDADRTEALVSAEAGDLDAAAESARAAVVGHESSPLRVELTRSLLVLARIERRRKARSRSMAALRRALNIATDIGHQMLLTEIQRELPRVAPARAGAGLTGAEQRVADLIVAGGSNRDVAAALFISVRTVETHVAAIYRKLGVRSRTELVRRLSDKSPADRNSPT